jgi:glucosamine--fructose-6-phosphate aminotransferase (isomerizing)
MSNRDNTYREIMDQASTMELVYKDILADDFDPGFLGQPYDEVIFFGCGTDYNLCRSASFITNSSLEYCSSRALPSSELILNTDTYINRNKKYLIMGFTRSGETTESLEVVNILKKMDNVFLYIVSAIGDSTIVRSSPNSFICRGAVENSVSMTKAYTGFLFAYCLMLYKSMGFSRVLEEFKSLIFYLKDTMDIMSGRIDHYLKDNDFDTFFALGSGFNYGIAVEADLKMKEMSQTHSYSYHLHEFNHGPRTMADSRSLVLILSPVEGTYRIERIIDDIKELDSNIFMVSDHEIGKRHENIYRLVEDPGFKYDIVKSFINIPAFQLLTLANSRLKGTDPDRPRNLKFTTKL